MLVRNQLSLELSADLPVKGYLVGIGRQEHVGPLELQLCSAKCARAALRRLRHGLNAVLSLRMICSAV